MSSAYTKTDTPVFNGSGLFSEIPNSHNLSREFDTAGWTFNTDNPPLSNLAFLPILGLLLLVICCLLKVYKWYQDKWKVRRGRDFVDTAELRYGIVSDGDKDFCHVDIPSDGTSVYDTVNSFRLLGNGFATQLSGIHPYHDTVTSYQSLLLQKADGTQYDSVKSYKAFLQKVTQNKDLAVEVKLLENYPIRSKSAEHCVVLEEESSERSEDVTTRMLDTLALNKKLNEKGRCPPQFDWKKPRYRRASGEMPPAMRKRSASNPISRRVPGPSGSLPSMRCTLSSDSEEEDTQHSLRMDRKKLWAERKKMSHYSSGSKIHKDPSTASATLVPCSKEEQNVYKRKRHYSADSSRRPKKAAHFSKRETKKPVNNQDDLKITNKITKSSKTGVKVPKPSHPEKDESSSENPYSSHSSCNSDVQSDTVQSETDEDTRHNTCLSNVSDDQTMENDVFFLSLDSGTELASSSELLENSKRQSISDFKKLIARAKEDFFMNKMDHNLSPLTTSSLLIVSDLENKNSSPTLNSVTTFSPDIAATSSQDYHSTCSGHNSLQHPISGENSNKPSHFTDSQSIVNSNGSITNGIQPPADMNSSGSTCNHPASDINSSFSTKDQSDARNKASENVSNPVGDSQLISSPRMVQRFHVTSVNVDVSSQNSD